MCCNSQTHVMVIAVICIIVSALCILLFFGDVTGAYTKISCDNSFCDYDKIGPVILGIEILIYVISLFSASLCLIGAICNNKYLLIPLMIVTPLIFLSGIGFGIYCFYLVFKANKETSLPIPIYLDFVGPMPIYLPEVYLHFVGLGLDIYFLVIVVKYYNKLSPGRIPRYASGAVCQPSSQPPITKQGLSNVDDTEIMGDV